LARCAQKFSEKRIEVKRASKKNNPSTRLLWN